MGCICSGEDKYEEEEEEHVNNNSAAANKSHVRTARVKCKIH